MKLKLKIDVYRVRASRFDDLRHPHPQLM